MCDLFNKHTLENVQSLPSLVFNFVLNLEHYLEQLNCAYSYISFSAVSNHNLISFRACKKLLVLSEVLTWN